ncbi:hypothetical protein EMIHUDRAFT_453098 [Emiliania huxleyi CCMP1516]|uniref:Sulfotransferase domain-containing protein n=2 Tax=Emiliania huxleyi TaxID=2903 RepID=A0A0D3IAT2_EMIH1|nr:hypothetical protein EMIHUDRAFT_453098 [Emiliania huxleyi CCMP1516]EOD08367.1 hypothetical protein EMIHUDRAFT_453098 [Emiliania huxleyi CCMP1516]|eukprot:XP_005760796.1 hypothetical protein EMIHUDRAFT_453098 [Emiliania huxleyi CCMP1516]
MLSTHDGRFKAPRDDAAATPAKSADSRANCSCVVDSTTVPAAQRHAPTASGSTSFLFLLGYPHTGTSSLHFLLATSGSVSTIGDSAVLGPSKEGMAALPAKAWLPLQGDHRPAGRWEPSFWSSNYSDLVERTYLSHWDRSKIFIESSPPEIYLSRELHSTFSKHGKVRFVLLVHGICGMGADRFFVGGSARLPMCRRCCKGALDKPCIDSFMSASWALALDTYRRVIASFGDDVFVIRYEDLCLRLNRVLRDLAAWEPRLADINVSRKPIITDHADAHHTTSTIGDHCELAVRRWREPMPALCSATPPAWMVRAGVISMANHTQTTLHRPASSTCASMAATLGYVYRPGQFDCSITSE